MNKYLKTVNLILDIFFVMLAMTISASLLWVLILNLISGIVEKQLSILQILWIFTQIIIMFLILISPSLMKKKWWFYYIWIILIIEFIILNIHRVALVNLYLLVPLAYTFIFYLVNKRVKQLKSLEK